MTELQQFKAMLDRAGATYGKRTSKNPARETIIVECGDSRERRTWTVTEFTFDWEGRLEKMEGCEGARY